MSPGNEQGDLWRLPGGRYAGFAQLRRHQNPAVDALIDRVIFTKSRADLVAATGALDRVLLWNQYVVPLFTDDRLGQARWDRFGKPESAAGRRRAFPAAAGGGMPRRPPKSRLTIREVVRPLLKIPLSR